MNELPVLLALLLATASVIVVVSTVRRRVRAGRFGPTEPVHSAQADAASARELAVYPAAPVRERLTGRQRRAGAHVDGTRSVQPRSSVDSAP